MRKFLKSRGRSHVVEIQATVLVRWVALVRDSLAWTTMTGESRDRAEWCTFDTAWKWELGLIWGYYLSGARNFGDHV